MIANSYIKDNPTPSAMLAEVEVLHNAIPKRRETFHHTHDNMAN
jgi:hypothetical protein